LKMRDIMIWLENRGKAEELASMNGYWDQYGLKDLSNP
jgi:orotate phosphoribosyltransferase